MRLPSGLALCLLGLLVALVAAQDKYEYDFSYDDYYSGTYDDVADDYGYYDNDEDQYYEDYGFYADDEFGYDDYYEDYIEDSSAAPACTQGKDGKVVLANGTATCDIKVQGVDKQADRARGGIEGLYKLLGCKNGKPMYKREKSLAGEDRVLYYSLEYGDWDISNGSAPSDDILAYGGDLEHHASPVFVKQWKIGADLSSAAKAQPDGEEYIRSSLKLVCADGKVFKPPAVNPAVQKQGPLLTAAEMDARYRQMYDKYGSRPEPNPTVNFTLVIMLVMIGLTIVLAIPYVLVKRKPAGKGYQPVATSFAQVIQQSKKKQSGHVH